MKPKTTNILGVNVSAITYERALAEVFSPNTRGRLRYVCVAAVHLIMECQKDARLKAGVNAADLVTPDGMPLVWLSQLAGKRAVGRVYGPDLMLKICERAARENRSIFLLGGAKGQTKQLAQVLKKRFPGLRIAGTHDTPARPIPARENSALLQKIRASKADFIFVGMGCPFQEQWMIDASSKLKRGTAIGVGAAFDFLTGRVKQAPRWMQNIGLEWLFRLAQEPRRLARRYILLNAQFLILLSKNARKLS